MLAHKSEEVQVQATTPGGSTAKQINFDNDQLVSGTARKENETLRSHIAIVEDVDAPNEKQENLGMIYIASDSEESLRSLQEDEHSAAALDEVRGPPANSEATPSDTCQNEGGQPEAHEGSANASAGLLAMSLQRVRDNASRQGAKRKRNPRKYTGVQSKVAKNVKVINKANKKVMKQKFQELLDAHQESAAARFQQSLSLPKKSDDGSSMRADRASQMKSSNRASRSGNSPAAPIEKVHSSPVSKTDPSPAGEPHYVDAPVEVQPQVNLDADTAAELAKYEA